MPDSNDTRTVTIRTYHLEMLINEAASLHNSLLEGTPQTGIYNTDLRRESLRDALGATRDLPIHALNVQQHCPACGQMGLGYPEHALNHRCPARGGTWTLMEIGPGPDGPAPEKDPMARFNRLYDTFAIVLLLLLIPFALYLARDIFLYHSFEHGLPGAKAIVLTILAGAALSAAAFAVHGIRRLRNTAT